MELIAGNGDTEYVPVAEYTHDATGMTLSDWRLRVTDAGQATRTPQPQAGQGANTHPRPAPTTSVAARVPTKASRGTITRPRLSTPYTLGQHIEHFEELGFNLIPLQPAQPGNKETGKRPVLLNREFLAWQTYVQRQSTPSEREGWWPQSMRYRARTGEVDSQNIGIVTGQVSNLNVIDIDDEETYVMLLEKVPEFSSQYTVKSGRGYHLYLRPEGPAADTSTFTYNGKLHHIKGNGGYVVAPPSLHYTNTTYSIILKPPVPGNGMRWTVPELQTVNIAELAEKMVAAGVVPSTQPEVRTSEPGWVSKLISEGAGQGERHSQLVRLSGYIAHVFGPFRADEGEAVMHLWNEAAVDPSLPRAEVTKAFGYAIARERASYNEYRTPVAPNQ